MHLGAHSSIARHLEGTHSFLSPSSPAWINYDEDKLDRVFYANQAARRGSEFHKLGYDLIRLRQKLPDTQATLNMYVNDGIGYGLTPEQLLYYSDNCYGHADTCGFRNDILRISDLKMGAHTASFKQLEIYGALFCLEYKFDPNKIKIELRIYQNNEIKLLVPEAIDIHAIMSKIKAFDQRLNDHRREALS